MSVVSYLKKKHGKAPVLRASAAMREQAMTAAYLSGGAVSGLEVAKSDFRFASLTDYRDPKFLPGAVKYGDVAWLKQALGKKLAVE